VGAIDLDAPLEPMGRAGEGVASPRRGNRRQYNKAEMEAVLRGMQLEVRDTRDAHQRDGHYMILK
jgi:hypothetical protein